MDVSVRFFADKLPLAYRMCMLSLIKEMVRKGDESAYHYYFSGQRPKPFVYSVFLQDFRMEDREIALSGFWLNLSSPEWKFLIPFLNGLQQTRQFQYKQYTMQRGLIRYGREERVQSDKIIVKTNSPILVEDEQGRPLSPADAEFNKHVNAIADQISLTLRGVPLKRPVRVEPISVKKTVVKESNDAYEQAVANGKALTPFLYFTAYHGRLLLSGDPDDLQWLLDTGLGLRTSQSFGHLRLEREVTNSDETETSH